MISSSFAKNTSIALAILFAVVASPLGGCALPGTGEAPGDSPARIWIHTFNGAESNPEVMAAQNRVRRFLRQRATDRYALTPLDGVGEISPRRPTGAVRLDYLGVTYVVTGRMRPGPDGFFILELIEPPNPQPVWFLDLPVMAGERLEAVADRALTRLEAHLSQRLGASRPVLVFVGDGPGGEGGENAIRQEMPPEGEAPLEEMASPSGSELVPVAESAGGDASVEESVAAAPPVVEASAEPSSTVMVQEEERVSLRPARFLEPRLISDSPGGEASPAGGVATASGAGTSTASAQIADSPAAAPTTAPTTASVELVPPRYRYAVQVGATVSAPGARKLARALRDQGFDPFLHSQRNSAGVMWHFIWIGRFWSGAKARELLMEYTERVNKPAFITPIDQESPSALAPSDGRSVTSRSSGSPTNALVPPAPVRGGPAPASAAVNGDGPFRFAVQVGAYRQRFTAEEKMAELRERGYTPILHNQSDRQGHPLRLVWIGRYPDRAAAVAARNAFRRREGMAAVLFAIRN